MGDILHLPPPTPTDRIRPAAKDSGDVLTPKSLATAMEIFSKRRYESRPDSLWVVGSPTSQPIAAAQR
jgi:hypothetical protein